MPQPIHISIYVYPHVRPDNQRRLGFRVLGLLGFRSLGFGVF